MKLFSLSGHYIRYVCISFWGQLSPRVVHYHFTDRQYRHIEVHRARAITTSNGIGDQTGKKILPMNAQILFRSTKGQVNFKNDGFKPMQCLLLYAIRCCINPDFYTIKNCSRLVINQK